MLARMDLDRPVTEDEPELAGEEVPGPAATNDDALRAIVERLGRSHPSGGTVVERAAILAEGADCTAVVAWIMAHAGQPEHAAAPSTSGGGLHGGRLSHSASPEGRPPARYVLPAGALSQQG
jgi:hypothetical protein